MLQDSMGASWNLLCQHSDKMDLDYGTLLSPNPVRLSIGTLRKPKLGEIDEELSLPQFDIYEMFLKITPELYYTKLYGEKGKKYWNELSFDKQNALTLFDIIKIDNRLQNTYLKILNFFFEETVIYIDGFFFLLRKDIDNNINIEEIQKEDVRGLIREDNFLQILDLIQQTCCIRDKQIDEENLKFKTAKAKKMYEKMLKARKEADEAKSKIHNVNLSLANIISAVSNKHPTVSPINVWELTVFQLYDSFKRLQINEMHNINCMRVSTWGDEKKTFDASLWYKNNFDKS